MSELRANTISDAAGTGPVTLTKQSAAKAWANVRGTSTVLIWGSVNVSSATDNGTGDYTVNFTSAFANTVYGKSCMLNGGNGGAVMAPYRNASGINLVGAHRMETRRCDTSNAQDTEEVNYSYFGDLA